MGKPMAVNLLKAGFHLCVFDINGNALNELRNAGAQTMHSLKEIAEKCDTVISMLPDSPQVREVALGEDGLIGGLSAGKLFIDMSTIDSAIEIEIHERLKLFGVDMLDAPVSGGETGAKSGSLSIMVGGKKQSFERALPVFRVLGKKINHMGDIGAGQITKSCSQIATALATQGVIEAFALAKKTGVDIAKVRDALLGGFAESRVLSVVGERIIQKNFIPGFKLNLYNKDLRIARQAAAERSLLLAGTQLMSEEMEMLLQQGKGELDFSALIYILEKESNF